MSTVNKLESQLARAKKRVKEIEQELRKAKEVFVKEMKEKGWQEFLFESDYYGNHQEMGEGNEECLYLFRPGIDLSEWIGCKFAHGHNGANAAYEKFEGFMEALVRDVDFIIVDYKTF